MRLVRLILILSKDFLIGRYFWKWSIYFQFLSNVVSSSLCHRFEKETFLKVFYAAVFTKRQDRLKASWKLFKKKVCAYASLTAWDKIVMQYFLVLYHGISHASLVVSGYTHEPLGKCVCRENTSDAWDIPWYTTQERCITSIFCLQSYFNAINFMI